MACDVIIPVYKSSDWLKLCVYALFRNTKEDDLGKVFLINDSNFDSLTNDALKNLKNKYGEKVEIIENEENLGFVKTVNKGFSLSKSKYVLLLNTDCVISKNTIGKLVSHLEKDEKIGLICPISSNAANLTLAMFPGFSYQQMNELLQNKFSGKNFNACTVVGNCLMISRKCLEKTGKLDEAFGTGYGEETDYQFRAMKAGFSAKVAIDTYVFHKSEASFGKSKEKQEKLEKNRELFFSRWSEEYRAELAKYKKNDPIKYIKNHINKDDLIPKIDTLFYLDGILQNAGGVHVVVDIVNYFAINGESANIIYNLKYPYREAMLFEPIQTLYLKDVVAKRIVSTVWKSAYSARYLADKKSMPLVSFVQGYETFFENGEVYGKVETSYKLADKILVISDYLKRELNSNFQIESDVIPNGINIDLLNTPHKKLSKEKSITFILRKSPMKGDWLLLDIAKKLSNSEENLTLNIVTMNSGISVPQFNSKTKANIIHGPLTRLQVYELLKNSDIYVDASLSEGFGLTALEAMAAGCVPVVSDSMGINHYMENGANGIVVNRVNNSDVFVRAIKRLLRDDIYYKMLQKNGIKTAKDYDFDKKVDSYIEFFNNCNERSFDNSLLSEQDKKYIQALVNEFEGHRKKIAALEVAKKVTPRKVKTVATKVINKLHSYYSS